MPGRLRRGEIQFDEDGNYIEPTNIGPNAIDVLPTLSGSLKPLLEFVDGYRRRNAAPSETLVRKKYTKYADLDFIKKRL